MIIGCDLKKNLFLFCFIFGGRVVVFFALNYFLSLSFHFSLHEVASCDSHTISCDLCFCVIKVVISLNRVYLISSIHSPRLKLPGNGYLTQDCWIKGNPKGIICLNKGNEKALITGKRNKNTSFSATFRQRWGQVGEGRLKVAWVFWTWWLGTHASCITQLVWMGGDVYTHTHL